MKPLEEMATTEKAELAERTDAIMSRNTSDANRSRDPLRQPPKAFTLDLREYAEATTEAKAALRTQALKHKIIAFDTSYTKSIAEMTTPVVDLALAALTAARSIPELV